MTEKVERPKLELAEVIRPFVIVGLLVAIMWIEELVDLLPHTNFDAWGIQPRRLIGLRGIVLAPFLHAGFGHLISNTLPFLILGGIVAASGVARYFQVTVIVALISGGGVWLFGQAGHVTIGASGIVFGYLTFLLTRGFFDRKFTYVVVGAVVLVVYGGIFWGLLPHPGISWTGHLFGAVGGVAAAWVLRTHRPEPEPKRQPGTAGTPL